jgi:hypothetical protein
MMKAGFVPQLRACGAKTKSYVVLVFTVRSSEGLTGNPFIHLHQTLP